MTATEKFFWKAEVVDHAESSRYWLEEVRSTYALSSDAKLAALLGMTKSAVSQLMTGKTKLGPRTAITMGTLLDVDPILILSSVCSLVEDKDQAFWKDVFEQKRTNQK